MTHNAGRAGLRRLKAKPVNKIIAQDKFIKGSFQKCLIKCYLRYITSQNV